MVRSQKGCEQRNLDRSGNVACEKSQASASALRLRLNRERSGVAPCWRGTRALMPKWRSIGHWATLGSHPLLCTVHHGGSTLPAPSTRSCVPNSRHTAQPSMGPAPAPAPAPTPSGQLACFLLPPVSLLILPFDHFIHSKHYLLLPLPSAFVSHCRIFDFASSTTLPTRRIAQS